MDDVKDLTVVELARQRFQAAVDYYKEPRTLASKDTRFALGDSDNGWQWEEDVLSARRAAKKVCLTVNVTAQHCNQIINGIRQNRPQTKVIPGNSVQSDKNVAEILSGIIRSIHTSSSADTAHDIAAEHSIYGGEGYWRVIREYEDERSFNQCLKIQPIRDVNSVYIDHYAIQPDRSDAEWGFVVQDLSPEQAKRQYPNIDPSSWVEDEHGWTEKETVRLAEYFYCEYYEDELYSSMDGSTQFKSEPTGAPINSTVPPRKVQRKRWKHCKLLGGETKPVEETDWPGSYLPIITVVGKELIVDGDLVRKGIVRDLKDPARMVNMNYSGATEAVVLQTKTPYLASIEAIAGFNKEWGSANVENYSYLPFNAYDASGNPLPRPERIAPAAMPDAQVRMLELSVEQMRAASGQQNANFGIRSDAQSGIGIQRLKQQGEIATFHFPDNLSRALKYEAEVLLDLIPKVMDTRQVVRMLGIDGTHETAIMDPQAQTAYAEMPGEQDVQKIFNPGLGKYDAVIDVGPSYQTQRQETADRLSVLAEKNPMFMQVAGDLFFRAQDFPMADQLADRWAKTLPPQLQDQKGNDPKAQLSQMQAALQQGDMKMQEMQQQGMALEQQLEQTHGEMQQLQVKLQQETQRRMQAELKAQASDVDRQKTEAILEITKEQQAAHDAVEAQHAGLQADMQATEPDEPKEDAAMQQMLAVLADGQTRTTEALAHIIDAVNKPKAPVKIEIQRTATGLVGVAQEAETDEGMME